MNQKALNERLRSAPNPVIDSYRKIVGGPQKQTMDQSHVGWRLLNYLVYKNQSKFFTEHGHWLSWKNSPVLKTARSMAEKAVSIGIILTQFWNGRDLNLMQNAIVKPYLKLDKAWLLGKKN